MLSKLTQKFGVKAVHTAGHKMLNAVAHNPRLTVSAVRCTMTKAGLASSAAIPKPIKPLVAVKGLANAAKATLHTAATAAADAGAKATKVVNVAGQQASSQVKRGVKGVVDEVTGMAKANKKLGAAVAITAGLAAATGFYEELSAETGNAQSQAMTNEGLRSKLNAIAQETAASARRDVLATVDAIRRDFDTNLAQAAGTTTGQELTKNKIDKAPRSFVAAHMANKALSAPEIQAAMVTVIDSGFKHCPAGAIKTGFDVGRGVGRTVGVVTKEAGMLAARAIVTAAEAQRNSGQVVLP